jgi:hypothetical protein
MGKYLRIFSSEGLLNTELFCFTKNDIICSFPKSLETPEMRNLGEMVFKSLISYESTNLLSKANFLNSEGSWHFRIRPPFFVERTPDISTFDLEGSILLIMSDLV